MADDPGWRRAWLMMPGMLIPGVAIIRAQRTTLGDGLVVLRSLFLSFVCAIVLIGGVVLLIGDTTEGSTSPALGLGIVVVAAAGSFVVQTVLVRPLDASSDRALGDAYRTRFFLRIAQSEVIALVAFVCGLVLGPWWAYFVGAAPALASLVRMAPTRAHLAADQDALTRAGSDRSLVDALRRTNVMTTGRR